MEKLNNAPEIKIITPSKARANFANSFLEEKQIKVHSSELKPLLTNVKEKLAKGELSIGSWVMWGERGSAIFLAKSHFDWIAIDLEHGKADFREVADMTFVIRAYGKTPLVRVAKNDYVQIAKALDNGAYGIIVPQVNNLFDAQQMVDYALYKDAGGERGMGYGSVNDYGMTFSQYKDFALKNTVLVAQIENIKAIENGNLEKILRVKEIDATFIGPLDMTNSMGIAAQTNHPEFLKVLKYYEKVSRKFGKPMGYHVMDANTMNEKINKGYRFIANGTDTVFMRLGLENYEKEISSWAKRGQ